MRSDTIDNIVSWFANINHSKLTRLESLNAIKLTHKWEISGYLEFNERAFLEACYEKSIEVS